MAGMGTSLSLSLFYFGFGTGGLDRDRQWMDGLGCFGQDGVGGCFAFKKKPCTQTVSACLPASCLERRRHSLREGGREK